MRRGSGVTVILAVLLSLALLVVGCSSGMSDDFRDEAIAVYEGLEDSFECNGPTAYHDRARLLNDSAESEKEQKAATVILKMSIASLEYCMNKLTKSSTDDKMQTYLETRKEAKSLLGL